MEPEDKVLALSSVEVNRAPFLDQARLCPTDRGTGEPSLAPTAGGLYSNVLLVVPTLNEEAGLSEVLG